MHGSLACFEEELGNDISDHHTGDQFACWFRVPVERSVLCRKRVVCHRALRLGRDLRAASLAPGGVCCPQTGRVVSRAHRFPEAPPAACYLDARKTLHRWPPLAALRTLLEGLVPRSVPSGSLDEETSREIQNLWRPPCHTVTLWVGLLSLSQCCF